MKKKNLDKYKDKIDLTEGIDEFKQTIYEHRNRGQEEEKEYSDIKHDIDYLDLLDESSLIDAEDSVKNTTVEEVIPEVETLLEEWGEMTAEEELEHQMYKAKAYRTANEELLARGSQRIYLKVFSEDGQEIKEKKEKKNYKQDVEAFIAKNLFSTLGGLMVVAGLVILFNYLVNIGFIEQRGRILIGFITGAVLYGGAWQLKDETRAISSVLVIAGTMALYYTAFMFFGFFLGEDNIIGDTKEQFLVFGINLSITSLAVIFALLYDRKTIAVFAIIGGYLTPLFLDADFINYFVFFTYLLFLNIAMLVIAYQKKWNFVNIMTFAISLLMFGVWLLRVNLDVVRNYEIALVFATLYYLAFFMMNVVYSFRTDTQLTLVNYILLLINTVFYVFCMLFILFAIDAEGMHFGFFTLGLTVFNYVYAYLLYKNENVDIQLLNTLITMTVIFGTVTAPLMLDYDYLNVLWATGSLLLLWVGVRAEMNLLKGYSLLLLFMAIIMMFVQWLFTYSDPLVDFFFNKATLTSIATATVLTLSYIIVNEEKGKQKVGGFQLSTYKMFVGGMAIFVLYMIGNVELIFNSENSSALENRNFKNLLLTLYNTAFALGLWIASKNISIVKRSTESIIFFLVMVLVYFGLGYPDVLVIRDEFLQNKILSRNGSFIPNPNALSYFMTHYVNLFLIFTGLILIARDFFINNKKQFFAPLVYFSVLIFLIHASQELTNLFVIGNSANITMSEVSNHVNLLTDSTYNAHYALLWTLCSFALMIAGMYLKVKELRIASLTLFLITLAKFFVFDFWSMEIIGRVLSLVVIGSILGLISYLYKKQYLDVLTADVKEIQQAEIKMPELKTKRVSIPKISMPKFGGKKKKAKEEEFSDDGFDFDGDFDDAFEEDY
jgi:hypothetical protein